MPEGRQVLPTPVLVVAGGALGAAIGSGGGGDATGFVAGLLVGALLGALAAIALRRRGGSS